MKAGLLRFGLNLWPPFIGAGIRVKYIAADFREASVELRAGLFNRNYIGSHFGGSLYAMTDPFYMLMLIHVLGGDYTVSHAGGSIDYLAPAKGTVTAHLSIDGAAIADIEANTASGNKYLPKFPVEIKNAAGDVVARVSHTIYVRRKPA